jgi:hypothetical protein
MSGLIRAQSARHTYGTPGSPDPPDWARRHLNRRATSSLRGPALRLCSTGSSALCRCVTPRRPHAGRVALAFSRRPAAWLGGRCLRGLPVLVHEVSRRVWGLPGLRLRRTEQKLALSPLFMLLSAHCEAVGVPIAPFRSSIAHLTYSPVYTSLCTSRYPTQNSGPSGSLLSTRENFAFSASCRLSRRSPIAIGRQRGGIILGTGATTESRIKTSSIRKAQCWPSSARVSASPLIWGSPESSHLGQCDN